MSVVGFVLTLPGIAGIVLTMGMAIDANVLIYERIREELRNGNSPQASIRAGFEKAWSTIFDANITTLIAAVVLLMFGTGPGQGIRGDVVDRHRHVDVHGRHRHPCAGEPGLRRQDEPEEHLGRRRPLHGGHLEGRYDLAVTPKTAETRPARAHFRPGGADGSEDLSRRRKGAKPDKKIVN